MRSSRATVHILFLFGAVWEVSAHILRDLATAPISPWPPVSKAGVEISALAVRAGAPCHRRDARREKLWWGIRRDAVPSYDNQISLLR